MKMKEFLPLKMYTYTISILGQSHMQTIKCTSGQFDQSSLYATNESEHLQEMFLHICSN